MRKNKDEVIIWHECDGEADVTALLLDDIAKELSEKTKVNFRIEIMNMVEYVEALTTVYKTKKGPDLALIPSDLTAIAEQGLFSEVSEEFLKEHMDKKTYETMNYKGKQSGVPIIGGNNPVFYYNKELVKDVPRDFEDLKRMKESFKKEGIAPLAIDLKTAYWFIPFFSAFGGWPIKDENLELDYEALKETFTFLREAIDEGIIVHYNATDAMINNFIDGKIACILNGEWVYSYLFKKCEDKVGVALIPTIKGKQITVPTSTVGWVFPRKSLESELKEPIMEFVKYMISEECQLRIFNEIHRLPINKSIIKKVKKNAPENINGILKQLDYCEGIPVDLKMRDIWDDIEIGLSMIKDHSNSIEDIVKAVLHQN